ncbi:hypothetical protein [Flavobacterium orientale]|uniref:Uncharacterized protein n=1 Tax=Flavobacterium orientale TaxID=1756020 RepID=A0A916Y7Y6_9FLAO|nr:hypothetical protein [Flavobacterium orientale]GGD34575.1 hypothetical protein GCM10011343_25580 [Flavobacterium orientale]
MNTGVKWVMMLGIIGMLSCNQKESQKGTDEKTVIEQEDAFQIPAVSLNSGKLWEANAATTEGIKNMQEVMAAYTIETGDAEKLVADLKAEFAMIFKKCTMTGEAHDQLHNYLLPLKTRIDNLSEEVTAENTADIKTYLNDYFNYFQ